LVGLVGLDQSFTIKYRGSVSRRWGIMGYYFSFLRNNVHRYTIIVQESNIFLKIYEKSPPNVRKHCSGLIFL